jgi:hypothetical protein
MSVDFFNQVCRKSINEKQFGLCDDEDLANKTPAYIDIEDEEKWIAIVKNENKKDVVFTAIDHCVFVNEVESRCDGMLQYEENIVFVELKDRSRGVTRAEQLERTIELFLESENTSIERYMLKDAYLSNKRKQVKDYLHKEVKDEFLSKTGFRLHFSKVIEIR